MRRLATMLLLGALTACNTPLLEAVDEVEANDAIATLEAAGLSATKVGRAGAYRVEVRRGHLAMAWRVMRSAGHPRTPQAEPPRLVLGPQEARLRNRRRLARRLEVQLRGHPNTVNAHVVLGDTGATIHLTLAPGAALDVRGPVTQVAAAAGLDPTQVVATTSALLQVDAQDTPASTLKLGVAGLAALVGLLALTSAGLLIQLRRLRGR